MTQDWNPESYARFRDLRLRPALDLLAQVQVVPDGDVIDLGCGDGAIAADLALRFPGQRLIGVDQSAAMLAKARTLGLYRGLDQADVALWLPHRPPALIFSNAALHWVGDHAQVLPSLARALMPGGVLAVQMPQQFAAPSHALLRDLAMDHFGDRFDFGDYAPPVHAPQVYWHMLQPLGAVQVWETEYLQHLAAVTAGHPVRHFTESTAMRPILAKLSQAEAAAFTTAYDAALQAVYPVAQDGTVLFPFRRLFLTLKV